MRTLLRANCNVVSQVITGNHKLILLINVKLIFLQIKIFLIRVDSETLASRSGETVELKCIAVLVAHYRDPCLGAVLPSKRL